MAQTEIAMNGLILLFLVLAVLCFVGFLGTHASARSGRQAAPPASLPMTAAPPANWSRPHDAFFLRRPSYVQEADPAYAHP
jgi:hypothetical protein